MQSVEEIRSKVLGELYLHEFGEHGERNLETIRDKHGWDKREFEKVVDRMAYDDLIKPWTMGGNYRIRPLGVLAAERESSAGAELAATNLRIRIEALKRLADAYEQGNNPIGLHYSQLFPGAPWPEVVIVKNLQLLEDLYYVESKASGFYAINFSGLDLLRDLTRRETLTAEFEAAAQLEPAIRGRKFQDLFARLLSESGWQAEKTVTTSNEEIDVVLSKRREYFLVECKWEKDPIEASVVRELFGKVSNRTGVNAILASMSGFSGGAVDQARDHSTRKITLLFGPRDIRMLFSHESSLDELLDAKYRAIVTRRKVTYD